METVKLDFDLFILFASLRFKNEILVRQSTNFSHADVIKDMLTNYGYKVVNISVEKIEKVAFGLSKREEYYLVEVEIFDTDEFQEYCDIINADYLDDGSLPATKSDLMHALVIDSWNDDQHANESMMP